MASGIHVELSAEGIDACPATALSREATVESIAVAGRAGGGAVGEATVSDPADVGTADAEAVFSDGPRSVYRFESDGECPCTRLPEHGCPIRDVRAEAGTLRLTFIAPDVEAVRAIVADLRSCCETVRIRRLTRSSPGTDERTLVVVDRSAFTDRQYEVLETAHEMGYFARPKTATAADVAAALDISPGTFSEHLSTTQSKLLDQVTKG